VFSSQEQRKTNSGTFKLIWLGKKDPRNSKEKIHLWHTL